MTGFPPERFPSLYLNEDEATARHNLHAFIAASPYGPEDLRADHGPLLLGTRLPRRQTVCDAHTPVGIKGAGLPRSYPRDSRGRILPHRRCQAVGARIKLAGLRGVCCRSAQWPEGCELAWFPATARSIARQVARRRFDDWYWR